MVAFSVLETMEDRKSIVIFCNGYYVYLAMFEHVSDTIR